MPSYSYVCPKCEATFTAIQKLSESIPKPKCAVCDVYMDRVFSISAIKFKGTGWGKDA